MGLISLPERGQPLDVNYIYEMANQIYELQKATTNTSTIIIIIQTYAYNNNKYNHNNSIQQVNLCHLLTHLLNSEKYKLYVKLK